MGILIVLISTIWLLNIWLQFLCVTFTYYFESDDYEIVSTEVSTSTCLMLEDEDNIHLCPVLLTVGYLVIQLFGGFSCYMEKEEPT